MQPVRRARATGWLVGWLVASTPEFCQSLLLLFVAVLLSLSRAKAYVYIMIIIHAAEILTSFRQRVFADAKKHEATMEKKQRDNIYRRRRRHYSYITIAGG